MLIAVSSCLLGNPVRYDAQSKANNYVLTQLAQYCDYISFCPEHLAFGTPREPIHLTLDSRGEVNSHAVLENTSGKDVTGPLMSAIETQIESLARSKISAVILKSKSPSCGLGSTPYFVAGKQQLTANGLFAEAIVTHYPYLPIIEECAFNDSWQREQFLIQLFCYNDMLTIRPDAISIEEIGIFHQKHQLLMACKQPQILLEMNNSLAALNDRNRTETITHYLQLFKRALASKSNQHNFAKVIGNLISGLPKGSLRHVEKLIEGFSTGKYSLGMLAGYLRQYFYATEQSQYLETSLLSPYPVKLITRTNEAVQHC